MVKLKQKKSAKTKVPKPKKSKPKLTKKTKVKENSDLSSMSVDDFLNQDFQEGSETEELEDGNNTNEEEQTLFEPEEDEVEEHKKSLEKLKETDPEFYKFLKENDKKLLKFDVSDEELDGDDNDDDDGKLHVPSGELEVASDESDFEGEDGEKVEEKGAITLKMLKKWQVAIQTDKTNQTIRNLVYAFHAALKRVSNSEEDDDEITQFKVGGI